MPSPTFRRRAVPALILAFVLGLHGAAWWFLNSREPLARHLPPSTPVRVSVRWLAPAAPASEPEPAAQPVRPKAANSRPVPSPRAPRAEVVAPATSRSPMDEAAREAIAAPAASAAQSARSSPAGAGPPQPSILDSAATRQAILDAARAPSLAELPGTTPPAGQTQRLGGSIAAGARGDCGKGEFAGGGMGLLSLPFWAAAKLRGDCSR